MAFFPTYREIVCVVFPPRVKGLMLESWRQSDQNIPRILIPHLASPQSLSMIKKTNRCSYMGPVNNDEECPDLLPEECRVVPLL